MLPMDLGVFDGVGGACVMYGSVLICRRSRARVGVLCFVAQSSSFKRLSHACLYLNYHHHLTCIIPLRSSNHLIEQAGPWWRRRTRGGTRGYSPTTRPRTCRGSDGRGCGRWVCWCVCMYVCRGRGGSLSEQARKGTPVSPPVLPGPSVSTNSTYTHMHVQVDHVAALQHALKETDGIGSTTACLASIVPGACDAPHSFSIAHQSMMAASIESIKVRSRLKASKRGLDDPFVGRSTDSHPLRRMT